jgi:hypothetical protein
MFDGFLPVAFRAILCVHRVYYTTTWLVCRISGRVWEPGLLEEMWLFPTKRGERFVPLAPIG